MTLPEWFREAREEPCASGGKTSSKGSSFIEKNLHGIASFMRGVIGQEEYYRRPGLLQGITPKARIAGVFFLIIAAGFSTNVYTLSGSLLLTVLLTAFSGVGFGTLAKRVWPSFVLTLILVSPVFFSFVTPGERLFGATIGPFDIIVTKEGALSGLFFITRVVSMVSLAALLLLTTGQTDFFKGLKGLPVPGFFVTALFMTFRYIFILLKIAEDSNLARRSRTISRVKTKESRDWFASRATLILKKSLNTAGEVNMAMVSRGFNGKIKTAEEKALLTRDYLWLGFTLFTLFLSFGLN